MDFDQIITSRRSIRFFSSKPVAPDLLTEILTLANYAPLGLTLNLGRSTWLKARP